MIHSGNVDANKHEPVGKHAILMGGCNHVIKQALYRRQLLDKITQETIKVKELFDSRQSVHRRRQQNEAKKLMGEMD
jgi:tmRNA-binding protein